MDQNALFNKKLLDFIDDLNLLRVGGKINLPQIETLRPFVMMYASMDPKKPQQMFDTYVAARYGDHIMNKDEQFLLNASFDDVQEGMNAQLDIVGMLKGDWQALSPANKSAIWQHLQVLMVLNSRCKAAAP